MAHQFTSGFSVAEESWHGLAKVLPKAPKTKEEAMEAAGLGLPMRLESIRTMVDPGMGPHIHTEVPGFFAVVRRNPPVEGRYPGRFEEPIGVVSKDYELIQDEQLFDAVHPLVDEGLVEYETAGSLQGGRKVWILLRIKHDAPEITPGDIVNPFAMVAHGNDGKMRLVWRHNDVRTICMNTMNRSLASGRELGSIFHTKGAGAKLDLSASMVRGHIEAFNARVAAYRASSVITMSESQLRDIAKEVFDPEWAKMSKLLRRLEERRNAAHSIAVDEAIEKLQQHMREHVPSERVDRIVQQFYAHEFPAGKESVWAGLNALTHEIDHTPKGGLSMKRFGSSWFGEGAQQRERACQLVASLLPAGNAL